MGRPAVILIYLLYIFLIFAAAELLTIAYYDPQKDLRHDPKLIASEIHTREIQGYFLNAENGMEYNAGDKGLSSRYVKFNNSGKINTGERYRVAIIGDSFTAGAGVRNINETYILQLNNLLKNQSKNHKSIELFAFAEGGLNSRQEYILMEHLVMGYQPDAIIVQFSTNDDEFERTNLGYMPSIEAAMMEVGGNVGFKINFLGTRTNKLLLHSAFFRFISIKSAKIHINQAQKINSTQYIDNMHTMADKEGISFALVSFPLSLGTMDTCALDINDKISNFSRNNGIVFHNLCQYVDPNTIKSDLEPVGYGGHYNKKGNEMAAQIMSRTIKEI